MSGFLKTPLAGPGSTNTAAMPGISVSPVPQDFAVEFVVEAVGATPTITYKLQGTFDPPEIADASANWFDIFLLPAESDTVVLSRTVTATGVYVNYISLSASRWLPPRVRLVPSANTNVTFRAWLRSRYRN